MPSPFPGMDPWLEAPHRWPGVHHGLIEEIRARLNQQLRPRYVATVEERVYISHEADPGRQLIRVPDVLVTRGRGPRRRPSGPKARPRGRQAVAEPVEIEPVEVLVDLLDDEVREARLVVTEVASRDAVAIIEVISPSNKVAGAEGRTSYLRKRQEVIAAPTHLVEIDLLRGGLPIIARDELDCDYLVHVSRSQRRPKGLVWPIQLRQQLPVVGVPLRGKDPDAPIDLQAVLTSVFDRGAYDLLIDYAAPPEPPLSPDDTAWAAGLLGRTGRRPAT
jgi:hypothetical protein